ncbi:TPA: hypothetical protein VCC40_001033, partial [Streptococcus pyogenes]|nr:hypothetical protein [Streptococcus pyogenes]HER3423135.1 hypothetical protein [Streptococcus pyogenes]
MSSMKILTGILFYQSYYHPIGKFTIHQIMLLDVIQSSINFPNGVTFDIFMMIDF